MSIPLNLERADAVIRKYREGSRPQGINDVIELYNIWLFVENEIRMKDWDDDTLYFIREDIKREVVSFFSHLKKETWTAVYKQVEFGYRSFFWDIIDRFSINGLLDLDSLRDAFSDNSNELSDFLEHERLVERHQQITRELLKENEYTAEWLLREFAEEDKMHDHARMFFPKSLTLSEREEIISRYLDSEKPNLNYVRLILLTKKDANLRLSDALRLKASKLEMKLNEEALAIGTTVHFKYTVSINSEPNKPLKWVDYDDDGNPILCYSKQLMQQYPNEELLHYVRFVFEFLTPNGLIHLVSKISESDVMERLIGMTGKYAYPTNMAFRYNEAVSRLQMEAMQNVLSEEDRNIENVVKVFYEQFLNNRFGYPSGQLTLADTNADWVTKCRTIAPEIDRIAQRYDLYAKTGNVDEDLLLISSDSVRVTKVKSIIPIRYYAIKGHPNILYRLFHLLFSDQSMLTFVEPYKEEHYHSFYQFLVAKDEKIRYENYLDYQKRDIDFLMDEGYLSKNEEGMICMERKIELGILKVLYEYHSCPSRAYGTFGEEILSEMEEKGWIEPDSYLLSGEERNYFDYYLYNSKYTNSRALRNRYTHGSHVDADKEEVHRGAYYRLLILLILELLKIEDDLIQQQLIKERKSKEETGSEDLFMITKIASVGSFSPVRIDDNKGDYLFVPRKFGIREGYLYSSMIPVNFNPAYFIQPKGKFNAEYISFVMNSLMMRTALSQNSQSPVSLSVEKIKSISLPNVSYPKQCVFGRFEHIIALLMAKGDGRSRDENLQLNMFSSLRDYLCMELMQPNFKIEYKIEFVSPFMQMMEQLDGDDSDMAINIMNQLFASGNVLMDNMKKARIVLLNKKE